MNKAMAALLRESDVILLAARHASARFPSARCLKDGAAYCWRDPDATAFYRRPDQTWI